jgi:thiol-disulfide isomerase/thioredoxin
MKTRIMKALTATLVIGLFAILTTAAYAKPSVTPGKAYEIIEVKAATSGKMTDFTFKDDKGATVSLSDVTAGKYTFLNFWGTWCPPCRREIPDIISLQNEMKDNLTMIGVALERKENPKEVVEKFAESQKINYINFVGSKEVIGKLTQAYGGISAVPTTYLIDKSNDIVEQIVGSQSKADFKAKVDRMIK